MPDKNTFDVKLWDLDQLLDLDPAVFNSLNRSELAKVTRRLADTANKRISRLEAKGLTTPANYDVYSDSTIKRFSTGGKDLNALRAEYIRAKNFLKAQTSTITGANIWKKSSIEKQGERDVNITPEQYDLFWKSYEKAKVIDPSLSERNFKYEFLRMLSGKMRSTGRTKLSDKNIDYFADWFAKNRNRIYMQSIEADEQSLSQELGGDLNALFSSSGLFEDEDDNADGGFTPLN